MADVPRLDMLFHDAGALALACGVESAMPGHLPGTIVHCDVEITDHDSGLLTDPTALRFVLLPPLTPAGQGVTSTYAGAVVAPVLQVIQRSAGQYRADVEVPATGYKAGQWRFRWEADGLVGIVTKILGSGESFFLVSAGAVQGP